MTTSTQPVTQPGAFRKTLDSLYAGASKAAGEVRPFFARVWAAVSDFFSNLGARLALWYQSAKTSLVKLGHQIAAWPKETKIAAAVTAVAASLLAYFCCKGSKKDNGAKNDGTGNVTNEGQKSVNPDDTKAEES